jgi:hypothetical protein
MIEHEIKVYDQKLQRVVKQVETVDVITVRWLDHGPIIAFVDMTEEYLVGVALFPEPKSAVVDEMRAWCAANGCRIGIVHELQKAIVEFGTVYDENLRFLFKLKWNI